MKVLAALVSPLVVLLLGSWLVSSAPGLVALRDGGPGSDLHALTGLRLGEQQGLVRLSTDVEQAEARIRITLTGLVARGERFIDQLP